MRRYELMLILKPDAAEDKAAAVIDRTVEEIWFVTEGPWPPRS